MWKIRRISPLGMNSGIYGRKRRLAVLVPFQGPVSRASEDACFWSMEVHVLPQGGCMFGYPLDACFKYFGMHAFTSGG